MDKKIPRRESREAAFLKAFTATFEPDSPMLPTDGEETPLDSFAQSLVDAMTAHAQEIDELIRTHLKGWELGRVPRVSLVALRLSLAEMLYGEEKKPAVAINEAVELVKKYGADNDHQFVNGLLGTVAREKNGDTEVKC